MQVSDLSVLLILFISFFLVKKVLVEFIEKSLSNLFLYGSNSFIWVWLLLNIYFWSSREENELRHLCWLVWIFVVLVVADLILRSGALRSLFLIYGCCIERSSSCLFGVSIFLAAASWVLLFCWSIGGFFGSFVFDCFLDNFLKL